jgi:hypothetical protein
MYGSDCKRGTAVSGTPYLGVLLAMASLFPAAAQETPLNDIQPNDVVIELFVRSGSEQCQQAEAFLRQLQRDRVGIAVHIHDVVEDRNARAQLWKLSRRFGYENAGVPSFFLADNLLLGFRDAQTTGRNITNLLQIRAFIRPGCRHCQAAQEFFGGLIQRWPALTVYYYDVVGNVEARAEVQQLARQYHVRVASFPCIQVAGRMIVGFQSAQITGRRIEAMFEHQSELINSKGGQEAGDPGAAVDQAVDEGVQLGNLEHRFGLAAMTGRLPAITTWAMLAQIAQPGSERVATPDAEETTPQIPELDASQLPIPDEVPLPEEVPIEEWPLGEVPTSSEPTRGATQQGSTFRATDQERAINVPVLGRLRVDELGLPTFTVLIGLVDGFNPCAMWVLIFLLSVLVHIKERKKIIVIAGTFILVSGLAYFAFMAAWFNVFQLIGLLRPVQIGLGLTALVVGLVNIKDFFAFHKGLSFSIPDSAKPGIYRRVREIIAAKSLTVALCGAIVLAVIVNVVELLCTAGLPALYTEILTMHSLPTWVNYSYLGLYIAAYMFDDAIMVTIAVVTLSNRKLQESEGRWLKLLSGCVISVLGAVMLFRPEWLV